jgi:hypothetical protein
MEKFNKTVKEKFDINLLKCSTASSLANQTFLKHFYDKKINPIVLIKDPVMFEDIKQAYYGGRVEVYKPVMEIDESGKKVELRYYDVNSLYPFASLNDIPGLICTYIVYALERPDLNNLFGFFYCKIKCDNQRYLGLLPKRSGLNLIFPSGE